MITDLKISIYYLRKSLSKSIVTLAEDDQKLKEYQSLARQRVVVSFSIEVMVHSLEKLYLAQII
jgi:glycosyltransferase involved in cell wall biosynthesis